MADFRRYQVWDRAHRFSVTVHHVTAAFPPDERYDLTRQIRRAARSIPANLAEGFGRTGDKVRAHFTDIALGSACELECHFALARDLKYVTGETHQSLKHELVEIRRMLSGLLKKLRSSH